MDLAAIKVKNTFWVSKFFFFLSLFLIIENKALMIDLKKMVNQ